MIPVTENEIRESFKRYKELDDYINELIEEKDEWYKKALATGGTSDEAGVKVKKSKTHTATDNAVEKVIELEKQINLQIDALCDLRELINRKINSLDNLTLKRVIYLKYVKGMSFANIAESIGYCDRQIARMHKKAMDLMFTEQHKSN